MKLKNTFRKFTDEEISKLGGNLTIKEDALARRLNGLCDLADAYNELAERFEKLESKYNARFGADDLLDKLLK